MTNTRDLYKNMAFLRTNNLARLKHRRYIKRKEKTGEMRTCAIQFGSY